MSIYGNILFEREYEKVLNGMKYQDDHDIFLDWDFPISDLKYGITSYNIARKPSRKVCRLRDIFWNLAYGEYHDDTDYSLEPDRIQSYNFGKMEIFV